MSRFPKTPALITTLVACAALAPVASAADMPGGAAPAMPNPGNGAPQVEADQAPGQVSGYALRGNALQITVRCSADGQVVAQPMARGARPIGTAKLRCNDGEAVAKIRLKGADVAKARGAKGLPLTLVSQAGGAKVKTQALVRPPAKRTATARSAATTFWNGAGNATCWQPIGSRGGELSIGQDSNLTFGARPGEKLYWRAYVQTYNGSWNWVPSGWNAYVPTSYWNSTIRTAYFGNSTSLHIPSGMWTRTGVQVYTASRGYVFYFVGQRASGSAVANWQPSLGAYEWCHFS